MKKIFKRLIILSMILGVVVVQPAYSQTDDKNQEDMDEALQEQINEIKERVASRVSELNLVEKRGIIGKVVDSSNTQITLEDVNGNPRFIDVDELTKFSSPSAEKNFGISDIEKGSQVSALGLYNKNSKRLLARFVNVVSVPSYVVGKVEDIDEDEFTLSVSVKEEKDPYTVEVETTTDTFVFDSEGLDDSGFSQISKGERIVIMGLPDKKDEKKLTAIKIIHFSESTGASPSPQEESRESTTSTRIDED